jgi:uncharacterized membrane protein
MPTLPNIILVLTATTTALIAGLFYAWSCSVTLGLARLPDTIYLAFMQTTNKAILNPVFFISFMGTAILLPVSTFLHYDSTIPHRFLFLLTATLIYLIGGLGVTMFGNVPLNEALDAFNLQSASQEAIAAQRAKFEGRWNNLNTIRTISSTLSIILVIIACLSSHKSALPE